MSAVFSLPLVKRKSIAMTVGLLFGLLGVVSMPQEIVADVPYVQAAMIVNGLILGALVTMMGFFTWHPIFQCRVHPLLRGAIIGAVVHLDQMIYGWHDQGMFWTGIAIGAAFGAVADLLATKFGGEGRALLEGIAK